MRLRTDDDIRKVRMVWMGPERVTLPFQLTYVQWAVGAAITALFIALSRLVVGDWWWTGVAFALSLVANTVLFKHVDHDRPVHTVLRTAVTDWRYTAPPVPGPERIRTASHVRVIDGGVVDGQVTAARRPQIGGPR